MSNIKTAVNRVGIMQGRLSPMIDGRIQVFPAKTWREEFILAKECGFELIEWVFDAVQWQDNPILSSSQRRQIIQLQKECKVWVPAVCCDYFMEYPLSSPVLEEREKSLTVLKDIIRICPELGIQYVELPFLGKAEIKEEYAQTIIVELLSGLVSLAEENNVYILLELSLLPRQVYGLLKRLSSRRIQLNYDTGNSAYWGYDPKEEFSLYGGRIGNIHIKDCTKKDYSLPLGEGEVDFDLVFYLLKKINYRKDFILQTARGDDDSGLAKRFYEFTSSYIKEYLI
ncbi:MAG: sugar phosphate isomerase/epimerase [Candidatus Omnitrophica bacterium]|nr:sugar phosphate isomerase/epimerase [Candidatus Omnitrophota bacterium]